MRRSCRRGLGRWRAGWLAGEVGKEGCTVRCISRKHWRVEQPYGMHHAWGRAGKTMRRSNDEYT